LNAFYWIEWSVCGNCLQYRTHSGTIQTCIRTHRPESSFRERLSVKVVIQEQLWLMQMAVVDWYITQVYLYLENYCVHYLLKKCLNQIVFVTCTWIQQWNAYLQALNKKTKW
jgi:hypothetical protein